jgi:hypothetical protein
MNRSGYGGVAGGLRPVVAAFDPELVLVSPLARALQTALVATEGGGGAESVPILVHPALAEVGGGVGPHATPANTCKHLPHLAGGPTCPAGVGGTASLGVLLLLLLLLLLLAASGSRGEPAAITDPWMVAQVKQPDYTLGGRFPRGKPGCLGLPRSQLRAALDHCYPRGGGGGGGGGRGDDGGAAAAAGVDLGGLGSVSTVHARRSTVMIATTQQRRARPAQRTKTPHCNGQKRPTATFVVYRMSCTGLSPSRAGPSRASWRRWRTSHGGWRAGRSAGSAS